MNGIQQILASIPKEKLLAMGKNAVSSLVNREQAEQPQGQVAGSKFYYPSSYKGISGIFGQMGGK